MGACASKPRDLAFPAAQLPGEKPAASEPAVEKPEEETAVAQEKKNEGDENQKVEEPLLVDLSEPTPTEDSKLEEDVSAPVVADLISAVGASDTLSVDQTEATKVAEVSTETKEDAPKETTKEPEVKPEILEEKKDLTPPIAST